MRTMKVFAIAVIGTIGIVGAIAGTVDWWSIGGAILGSGLVLLYQWSARS